MSKIKRFEPGQTVYSIHGASALYVAATTGGHAVEQMYEYEDGEPHFGPVTAWPECFAAPPVEILHDKVKELEERISERRQILKELGDDKQSMEKELHAMHARYSENEQLRNLDLWISGAVTHLVKLEGYGFKIGTVEEILGYDNDKEMRLLSIYGGTKRNYRWKMASYSDGSGSNTEVLLATSEEEAIAAARKWFASEISQCVRNRWDTQALGLAMSAIRYGIEISDDLQQKVSDAAEAQRKRALEQAQQGYERAKQHLDEASAAIAKARGEA